MSDLSRVEYASKVKADGTNDLAIQIPKPIGDDLSDESPIIGDKPQLNVGLETVDDAAGICALSVSPATQLSDGRDLRDDKGRHPYRFRIPRVLHRDQEEFQELNNPFYGIDKGDSIRGRYDFQEKVLRIFTPEQFIELTGGRDVRTVAFLTQTQENSGQKDRWLNLAKDTEYEGQKVELIPFDSQHDLFKKEAENVDFVRGNMRGGVQGNHRLFNHVKEKHGVPRVRVEKLVVRWNPDYTGIFYSDPSASFSELEEATVIHTEYSTKGVDLILPKKGSYNFRAFSDRDGDFDDMGDGKNYLYFSPPDDFSAMGKGWVTRYKDFEGDTLKVYVPANFGRGDENTIATNTWTLSG